jgi:hypothetical protein
MPRSDYWFGSRPGASYLHSSSGIGSVFLNVLMPEDAVLKGNEAIRLSPQFFRLLFDFGKLVLFWVLGEACSDGSRIAHNERKASGKRLPRGTFSHSVDTKTPTASSPRPTHQKRRRHTTLVLASMVDVPLTRPTANQYSRPPSPDVVVLSTVELTVS